MIKRKIIAVVLVATVLLTIFACVGVALTAGNDLFKNNTPTYMKLGNDITGIITSKKDYEAYIFEVEENGTLTFNLEHENFMDPAKSGWDVTLYKITDVPESRQKNYIEISNQTSFWSDVTSDWKPVGLSSGTYCILVAPGLYFLDSEYTLKTSFAVSNNYEAEPNDTKENATPISVGYGKYGLSSNRQEGTDVDWYVFDITKDSCINISFTHPDGTFPTVGWTVSLIDSTGEKITQFASRKTDLIIKTGAIGLKPGRYYVNIEAQADSADEYTILVGADKAVNFEFEVNDTPEQAISLPHGVGISGSLAEKLLGLDKDYYKFTVEGKGYIDLLFTHTLQDGDKNGWNIRVLKELEDGSYHEIVRKISKWNEESLKIEGLGLAAGEYYVLIDGDSVAYNSSTYTVKWNFTEKENYEREPNSTMLNCQTVEFNQEYYGSLIYSDVTYDEDYYRFRLVDDKSVAVQFAHEAGNDSGKYWTISIINDKGEIMKQVESSLNESLVSTGVVELPAGVYFVKIETGMYGSEIPYSFKVVG